MGPRPWTFTTEDTDDDMLLWERRTANGFAAGCSRSAQGVPVRAAAGEVDGEGAARADARRESDLRRAARPSILPSRAVQLRDGSAWRATRREEEPFVL